VQVTMVQVTMVRVTMSLLPANPSLR